MSIANTLACMAIREREQGNVEQGDKYWNMAKSALAIQLVKKIY